VADEHATPSERGLAGPLTTAHPARLLESSA
jgi:hypothetical protein